MKWGRNFEVLGSCPSTFYPQLAAISDVLVENYIPGTLSKMGLGYSELSAEYPHLIYCSITGESTYVHYWIFVTDRDVVSCFLFCEPERTATITYKCLVCKSFLFGSSWSDIAMCWIYKVLLRYKLTVKTYFKLKVNVMTCRYIRLTLQFYYSVHIFWVCSSDRLWPNWQICYPCGLRCGCLWGWRSHTYYWTRSRFLLSFIFVYFAFYE